MDKRFREIHTKMQEKALLNILMESALYLELTLNERRCLLKRIVECYYFPYMPGK